MRQLVNELLEGIRLPRPESCPATIASLIQQCFFEDASKRPSFEKIKEVVKEDYEQLRRAPKPSDEILSNDKEELEYADLEFEQKYLEMRIKNKDQQQTRKLKTEETIVLDSTSMTASFKNEAPRYVSLSDVTTTATVLPKVTLESHHSSLSKEAECAENEILLRSPRLSLSPGLNGHQRSFSYGGNDLTPTLQPERLKTNPLIPSKSYPNPTYMIFPSIMNSNTTIIA